MKQQSNYTFRHMLVFLKTLSEEQLDLSATIYQAITDEAFPIIGDNFAVDKSPLVGVLDDGHPYFVVNN